MSNVPTNPKPVKEVKDVLADKVKAVNRGAVVKKLVRNQIHPVVILGE